LRTAVARLWFILEPETRIGPCASGRNHAHLCFDHWHPRVRFRKNAFGIKDEYYKIWLLSRLNLNQYWGTDLIKTKSGWTDWMLFLDSKGGGVICLIKSVNGDLFCDRRHLQRWSDLDLWSIFHTVSRSLTFFQGARLVVNCSAYNPTPKLELVILRIVDSERIFTLS
jgi:hypothetical protein